MLSIIELGKITAENDTALKYVRSKGLIRDGVLCETCDLWMKQITDNKKVDKYFWRCNSCKATRGVRQGSFFEDQKFQFPVPISILYLFANVISGMQASTKMSALVCQYD